MNFMDDIKEQLLKKEFEYDAVDADRGKMDRNALLLLVRLKIADMKHMRSADV